MECLRELRKKRKLKQSTVAQSLGITVQTYSNYELGQREPPFATLLKLADYFNVTVDYLLGRDPDITKLFALNLEFPETYRETITEFINLSVSGKKAICYAIHICAATEKNINNSEKHSV